MRLIATLFTFLGALMVIGLVVALATGGVLRDPDAAILRPLVWAGILAGAGLVAWWRWWSLGRRSVAKPEPASTPAAHTPAAPPSPPAPRASAEEVQSAAADRLSRISVRGREAASNRRPPMPMPHELVPPPGADEQPAPPADADLPPSPAVASDPDADSPLPGFPADAGFDASAFDQPPPDNDLDFGIASKTGRPRANIGLTPMGAGDDEDEEDYPSAPEEEEGPVYGEEPDDTDAGAFDDAFDVAPDLAPAPEAAAGDRTAILFRQIFPPRHDDALCFFGGAPIASPGFAWPRAEGGGPFTFLMQIDCADIPARARMGMPGRGLLHVFMDLGWGQQDAFRVIHDDAAGDLMEIAPPDDLAPAYGDQAKAVWGWPRSDEGLPRLLPKWPFRPIAIDLPAAAWGAADPDGDAARFWPAGPDIDALLMEAQGEEIGPDWFKVTDFIGDDGALIRPFPAFPHDARAIQIMSSLILNKLDRSPLPRAKELEDHSEEGLAELKARISAEAQAWYEDAGMEPPFSEVPQEFADQYWNWLAGFPWLARFVITDGVTLSVEDTLAASPQSAARIPPQVVARLRHRHAIAIRREDGGIHAPTPDRMLAPPVDVQGHQYERARTHILLLELKSNEGLGHHFGEGVYQFWIRPEDLAAGRFDKVELTADAY